MTTKINSARTFTTFVAALAWAKTYARESCHFFHAWRVVKIANGGFAVAIVSKNTGAVNGYAV